MKLKKSAKTHKNDKTQHLFGCFKSKNQYKKYFFEFLIFEAHFERKIEKKKTCMLVMIFSQFVGKNQHRRCLPCEIPCI